MQPVVVFNEEAGRTGLFARDRNISVAERPQPDFDKPPLSLGSFRLRLLAEGGVDILDDVLADPTRSTPDTVLFARPIAALRSGWSQHALDFGAQATFRRFLKHERENSDDWSVLTRGRLDIGSRAQLQAGASLSDDTESRLDLEAPQEARRPVRYTTVKAFAGAVQQFSRVRFVAFADYLSVNVRDTTDRAGLPLDQDYRDSRVGTIGLRGEYAMGPAVSLFVSLRGNKRDYPNEAPDQTPRDSKGYELAGGANVDITRLVRGEARLGYVVQDYDAAVYRTVRGLQFGGRLIFFMTPLTNVTLSARRSVRDSRIPGVGGSLSTNVGLDIDHELLRNLVLNAGISYNRQKYRDFDETSSRRLISFGARFRPNPSLQIRLAYENYDRNMARITGDRDVTFNHGLLSAAYIF